MPLDWDLIDTPLTSVGGIAYSPTLERVVMLGDVYMYSDDGGVTWTEVTKPTAFGNDQNAVCWDTSGLNFLCVLNNNFDTNCVVKSPDGINWSIVTTPITGLWNAIASNGSRVVAVGNDGKVIYSTDGGTTWSNTSTDLVSLGATTDWDGIAWNPISAQFVAVARNGNIRIATSPNGIAWTGRHGFEVAYQKVWNSIASSPGGIMVATCDSNGYDIMRSLDGTTWETPYKRPLVPPVEQLHVMGIIWSNLLDKFIFIQYSSSAPLYAYAFTSEDGIDSDSWVADAGPIPPAIYDSFGPQETFQWGAITEAFELERFIAGSTTQETLTAIITSLSDPTPPPDPDILIEYIGGEDGGGIEMGGGGSGTYTVGWAYTGSGGIEMGGDQTQMVLSVDSSGIYTFIADQRFDRVYTRNSDPDDTTDVKIPDPFIKTAYLGS